MSWSIEKLENILKYCKHNKSLAVFDIDSTLLDVTPRSLKIMEDFKATSQFNNLNKADQENYPSISYPHNDWGPFDAMKRALITKPAQDIIFKFWWQKFFINEYLHHDRPYPGAEIFVQQLHKAGTDIAYLTARKKESMIDGTLASLKNLGFPLNDSQTRCVLKEEKDEDHSYKYNWLKNEIGKYSKIFYFENEAKIVNYVREQLPDIEIIFMDTIHSQEEPSPIGLPTLPGKFTL